MDVTIKNIYIYVQVRESDALDNIANRYRGKVKEGKRREEKR